MYHSPSTPSKLLKGRAVEAILRLVFRSYLVCSKNHLSFMREGTSYTFVVVVLGLIQGNSPLGPIRYGMPRSNGLFDLLSAPTEKGLESTSESVECPLNCSLHQAFVRLGVMTMD